MSTLVQAKQEKTAIAPASPAGPRTDAVVDLVVPVYNEERSLERNIRRLRSYLDDSFPLESVVTIADNASVDRTWAIAQKLACQLPGVRAIRLQEKGRGRALRAAWSRSDAYIVGYMDVDLSTDLGALLPLVAPLLSGHSDVSIGSRLTSGSKVVRGPKRELISRSYNLLVRTVMRSHFSDAQCGFKALRREAALQLLPMVHDNEWFFDTEVLVLAEQLGMRIYEVPVDWVDDSDSRVNIKKTALDDLRGLLRLSAQMLRGKRSIEPTSRRDPGDSALVARFARVGLMSTLAYVLLYLVLRGPLGIYAANALALGICAIGNTVAQAKFTFWLRGPFRGSHWVLAAIGTFLTSAILTTGMLWLCTAVFGANALSEVVAIALGTAAAALARFILLKAWVFKAQPRTLEAVSL